MATRYNNGSHYENHQRAAELHDVAAHAHRVAAEAHEKQDHQTGHERTRQALEHSRATSEHNHPATLQHREIAERAHQLWELRGCPQGSPEIDWNQALQELRARVFVG